MLLSKPIALFSVRAYKSYCIAFNTYKNNIIDMIIKSNICVNRLNTNTAERRKIFVKVIVFNTNI